MNTRGARVAYATPEISEWLSLDGRLAVRRGLAVRPMARRDAETADPMHIEAALRAVEAEVLELAFEVGLHLQELEPEHLGVGNERIGPAVPDVDRLVDERIGLLGLVSDGVDGALEDVSFPLRRSIAPCLSRRVRVVSARKR
jgi:hypothetical protein